jgi:ribulose-5-phosphate 4-epimerase/fuculose-1-phosphate aldolase
VPDSPGNFLINLNGMLLGENTTSSRLRVGEILHCAGIFHGLHPTGFTVRSAIYGVRPDTMAAMHAHAIAAMKVSVLQCGLWSPRRTRRASTATSPTAFSSARNAHPSRQARGPEAVNVALP